MGELVLMLFDTMTLALFVGGCLLLWLNLRRRGRDVRLTPKENSRSDRRGNSQSWAGSAPFQKVRVPGTA